MTATTRRAGGGNDALRDRVAVITGSSRGIGRAVADAFARSGAAVVVNGRTRAAVARAVRAIRGRGGRAIGVAADVSTPQGAARLLARALAAYGRVDVLINNAGVGGPPAQPAWRIPVGAWRRVLEVNLTGPFLCASAFIRHLCQTGRAGRIINVGSTAGERGFEGLAPYCASKSGLRALTEVLALDLHRTPIVVTGVELDAHRTEMTRSRLPPILYEGLAAPAAAAVPLFLFAATAPGPLLHGRTLSEARYRADPEAEAALNGPLALVPASVPYMPRYRSTSAKDAVHLDFLENLQGPSPAAAQRLRALEGPTLARYPDPRSARLRRALSAALALPEDCFTFGNGSSELVERVLRVFARRGDSVVTTDPTWPVFERFCRRAGVEARLAPYRLHRRTGRAVPDYAALLEAIGPRTRLVYLVSPSNPLGGALDREAFLGFLARLPGHLPVVVDEAYIEYTERPGALQTHELILEQDHPLIGIRTFSKFYALAGLRVGYAFGAPSVVRLLARGELAFSISAPAETAATGALADRTHQRRIRAANRRGLAQVSRALARLGLHTLRSDASFLMGESPAAPEATFEALARERVHLPQVMWRGYIQLPIGRPEDNRRYLRVLGRLRRAAC